MSFISTLLNPLSQLSHQCKPDFGQPIRHPGCGENFGGHGNQKFEYRGREHGVGSDRGRHGSHGQHHDAFGSNVGGYGQFGGRNGFYGQGAGQYGQYGHGGQGYGIGHHGGAGNVQSRPLAMQKDGSSGTVTTAGGYQIKATAGDEGSLTITAPDGKTSKIYGDPHVDAGNGQKFDFTQSGFSVTLPDGTELEIATKKLDNGTSLLDTVNVLDQRSNSGVRMSGLSNGSSALKMQGGRADLLDQQIAEDGVETYWNFDGSGMYTMRNDIGGYDTVTSEDVKAEEQRDLAHAGQPQVRPYYG